jgi:cell division protein FtsI (penicillin-binding protein 3)
MRYDIYLDFKTMKDTVYSNNIGALTDSLSKMFGKQEENSDRNLTSRRKIKTSIILW